MIKAWKTMLRPTEAQAALMEEHAGYNRWVYNRLVDAYNEDRDNLPPGCEPRGYSTLARAEVRPARPEWALRLNQAVLDNAVLNFHKAVRRYSDCGYGKHEWHKPRTCGHPRHHKKKDKVTFTPSHMVKDIKLKVLHKNGADYGAIHLPKIGYVRIQEALPDYLPRRGIHCKKGEARTAPSLLQVHISRVTGRWWVALVYEDAKETPEANGGGHVIGVDVGIKTLAVTSDGEAYENPRPFQSAEKRLRAVNKAIARSQKVHGKNRGSKRRTRLYQQRVRLYGKQANQRKTLHRQVSAQIANAAGPGGAVVVESLNVSGLVKNRRLAKALQDAGLGNLLQEIKWQCRKRGVRVIEAGKWYPSTQTCAICDRKLVEKIPLGVRIFRCEDPSCGWVCDRDYNAALSLQRKGLLEIKESPYPSGITQSLDPPRLRARRGANSRAI